MALEGWPVGVLLGDMGLGVAGQLGLHPWPVAAPSSELNCYCFLAYAILTY